MDRVVGKKINIGHFFSFFHQKHPVYPDQVTINCLNPLGKMWVITGIFSSCRVYCFSCGQFFYCTGVLIASSRFSLPSSRGFIVPTEYDIHMAGNSRLRRLIGKVYRIGLGGEGVLRTEGREQEAQKMLEAAYESGIRYFDSAPAYADSERYYGRFWDQHPNWKAPAFQTSKSAQRDAKSASADLTRTLSRMGRDRLGLWQIHDVRNSNDIRRIEGPGGALKAFYHARETGTALGIGVTGHHDPAVLLHAVTHWDIDSVLLPVNPVESAIGGFLDLVIPAARERGIGVIGMKTMGAGNYILPEAGLLPEVLIRFALSQDVDLVIVGCSTPEEARLLARLGKEHIPMEEEEQGRIIGIVRPNANRLAYYRGVT
jgi:aryl-alcohol dehydrogenase-like predicted oxidoreductase